MFFYYYKHKNMIMLIKKWTEKMIRLLLERAINIIVDRIILWPFYYPIILSMKKVKISKVSKSNGVGILAINTGRFRGDLESLARAGFEVYMMPYKWQTRIFYAYKDRKLKSQFRNPPVNSSIHRDRDRVRKYLSHLLELVFLKKNIDCIIGAGLFYNQDIDWGAAAVNIGRSYIVLHRENLVVSKAMHEHMKGGAKKLNKSGFVGTAIIFQNKVMKKIYDEYSGVDPSSIYALGSLRMDGFIKKINSKKISVKNERITLFSFFTSNVIPKNIFSDNFGWYKLHDDVHTSFVELAKENPSIEFVIKHKGVGWSRTEKLLQQLNASNVVNLKIYGEGYDAQTLILDSDIVTGFCSTSLLEASIANKPIIYPLFAEALDKKYSKFICFEERDNLFDVAGSNREYKELIIKRYYNPVILQSTRNSRKRQFEKYVSSVNTEAIDSYSEVIISITNNHKSKYTH
jgi:glycosyltransferase involved in cell wall biosynthesis